MLPKKTRPTSHRHATGAKNQSVTEGLDLTFEEVHVTCGLGGDEGGVAEMCSGSELSTSDSDEGCGGGCGGGVIDPAAAGAGVAASGSGPSSSSGDMPVAPVEADAPVPAVALVPTASNISEVLQSVMTIAGVEALFPEYSIPKRWEIYSKPYCKENIMGIIRSIE